MVTAGVYLVCRLSGVFVLSPAAMFTVATIGGLTAVLAATIALVQNDIKRVLAYSTVSQLGYMFIGVGVGAFSAGFFHVLTHAFFKACLFLGSGSVIHAMHARIHDTDASQDMRNMGGLKRFMPITFWTFVAAWAAIVAVPFTSGFFSKDEILFQSYTSFVKSPVESGKLPGEIGQLELFQWPDWGGKFLLTLGVLAAVMTAFYMTRLVIGIFFGEFRGWTIVKRWKPAHGHHDHHHDDHEHGKPLEGPTPHEAPWQMTLPLVVLAGLSVVGGFFNPHALVLLGTHLAPLDHWLEPVFKDATEFVAHIPHHETMIAGLMAPGLGALLIGGGLAYWMYLMQKGEPAKRLAEQFPRLHALVYDKWRVDEFYDETILGAVDTLAEIAAWADRWLVDGLIARLTSFVVAAAGTGLRYVQTGRVQAYAAMMLVGVCGLGWFLIAPHAEAKVKTDHSAGNYSVTAAPGLGYRYRWDADGDGTWDNQSFSDQTNVDFSLEPDKPRTVRLDVVNAFGRTAEKEFSFVRPKPDRSRGPTTTMEVTRGADGQLRAAPTGVRPTGSAQVPSRMDPAAAQRLLRAIEQQRGGQPGQPGQPPGQPGQPAPQQFQRAPQPGGHP
jgi:NADH-quinone oxidoreductase subunit L